MDIVKRLDLFLEATNSDAQLLAIKKGKIGIISWDSMDILHVFKGKSKDKVKVGVNVDKITHEVDLKALKSKINKGILEIAQGGSLFKEK